MSGSKRYYWLKLKEDFFDDDTIRYIEEQSGGILYSNFYLKLCLKSLKFDGKLIRIVGDMMIPYDENALSRLTNVPIDTVRCAMALFKAIGLVRILDSGEIYMAQVNELVGNETDKAAAMRKLRATRKFESSGGVTLLPECYTEIEKEKESKSNRDIDNTETRDNERFAHDSYHDSSEAESGDEEQISPKQPKNKATASNSGGIDYEAFATAYNQRCTKLPSCRKMTEKRKTAVRKFLKEYSFADWQKVCELANTSSFLCGASERGWRADFDWLLKTEKATKILEGGYQGGSKNPVARQWDRMTLRDYHSTYSDDSGCEDDFDIGDENE